MPVLYSPGVIRLLGKLDVFLQEAVTLLEHVILGVQGVQMGRGVGGEELGHHQQGN